MSEPFPKSCVSKEHSKRMKPHLKEAFRIILSHYKGWTDLHWAAFMKDEKTVKQLLENHAEVNQSDACGYTPLHVACKMPYNGKCIANILMYNPQMNRLTDSLETPLSLFLRKCTYTEHLLKKFLLLGADPDIPDNKGNTPLHYIARGDDSYNLRLRYARVLMEHKAKVNLTNNEGDTPLHYAVFGGFEGLVRLLVENGASLNTKNNDGLTQMNVAFILNDDNPSIYEFLTEHSTWHTEHTTHGSKFLSNFHSNMSDSETHSLQKE